MSIQHTTRERSIELQGEIKRARDVVAECEASEHEHQRALENAQRDTVAANARLAELLEEQKQLAQQAHDEVMGMETAACGHGPPCGIGGCAVADEGSGWDGHASDCATHNEPAMPNGVCDCEPQF